MHGPGSDRRHGRSGTIAAEDGVPWLELLREHVPQLGVEIIAGAGHFSMIERPTAVNAAIEKFISSLLA
jgi:pimeloyl-ACP methyl ester carboxylesterase